REGLVVALGVGEALRGRGPLHELGALVDRVAQPRDLDARGVRGDERHEAPAGDRDVRVLRVGRVAPAAEARGARRDRPPRLAAERPELRAEEELDALLEERLRLLAA